MDRNTAIARVKKLLGKKAYINIDDGAPKDDDERAALREQHRLAREDRDAAMREMNERTAALQRTDPLYQAALSDWKAAGKRMQATQGYSCRKFNVGITDGVAGLTFAHILAAADRWEDVFAELAKKGYPKK